MKLNRVGIVCLLLTFAFIFVGVLLFQSRAASDQDFPSPVHVSVDWSNRHLIYSGEPKGPNAWVAMQDPRYLRHHAIYGNYRPVREESGSFDIWRFFHEPWPARRPEESPLDRDWQVDMGTTAVVGPSHHAGEGASFPAKFSFDLNATPSCTNDFVVFPTGLAGVTGGQTSIFALNQLYSGSGTAGNGVCGTGQPSVMWAYNTNLTGDTGGAIYSSPVLSLDGTKVAFIETGGGSAILKILQWVAGQGTISASVTPTPIITGNAWSTCSTGTSCLFSLTLTGSVTDSFSSPFYNYANDTLYVGDDKGALHKFTGVFEGIPAEVTTGGWPFTLSANTDLTGPVFDSVSGNIFVSNRSKLYYVRETGSSVGACGSGTPPCIGTPILTVSDNSIAGVMDPPTVDITSQMVYVFPAYNPTGAVGVIQTTTALGTPVDTVLQSRPSNWVYSGAFDGAYHSGNYASGFLYVCGTNTPTTLFRIGFNSSGVMNSTVASGSTKLSNSIPSCSPMTEIVNGTNDYLFFGLNSTGGLATGCAGGCLLGLNLATMTWPPAISAFSSLTVAGGTSAIVVDNVGTGAQESSVYFGGIGGSNCTTPSGSGCAVKATQSGLH